MDRCPIFVLIGGFCGDCVVALLIVFSRQSDGGAQSHSTAPAFSNLCAGGCWDGGHRCSVFSSKVALLSSDPDPESVERRASNRNCTLVTTDWLPHGVWGLVMA